MQQLALAHPQFKIQKLAVQTAGWFAGPTLLVNGSAAKKQKGRFTVRSDAGQDMTVELKHNFLDPIPRVRIAGDAVQIAPPLRWYEYAWIGIPFVFIFTGGAIGGFVGALGAIASGHAFRSEMSTPAKYAVSALITLGSFAAFVVLAAAFQMLL